MSLKGFRTQLKPNNHQRTLFAQHCGVSRWAYNWGLDACFKALDERNQAKESGQPLPKFPSSIDLHKKLVAEEKPNKQWLKDASKCAPQQALRDLESAWRRKIKVKGSGTPRRKKKFVRDGFYLEGAIQIKDNFIKLPKIGFVKLPESVPDQTIKNVRVSRKANEWFVSFKVEVDIQPTVKCFAKVGVDLGIKTLATLSDGTVYPAITPYRKNKVKLAKLQRKLSKQIKGGKNREKTKHRIAKLHAKIANIRNDAAHKLTSHLTKNHREIVIEDLNVGGMMKNHKLASAIADSGFYEFKRQLEYKAQWYGSKVTLIDRWYPSSQLCSGCGHRKPMPLKLRQYDCSNCGLSLDRDLNAAINIRDYSENTVSSMVSDCGRGNGPSAPVEAVNEPQLSVV
jgi:putative transposase